MCRQYDAPPPFPYAALLSVLLLLLQVLLPFIYSATAAATVAVAATASACASTVLFDYLINGLGRLLRKQTTALFYGWLIKQSSRGRAGGGRASVCLRLGGMPQTPVQEIFTWLEWRRCPLQLGMGTRSKGAAKGARDWEGGKCQWANRKYKSRALKATPKNRANPRKPRTENRRYQRTKRR